MLTGPSRAQSDFDYVKCASGASTVQEALAILKSKFSRKPIHSDGFDTETWRDEGRWCLAESDVAVNWKCQGENCGFTRLENGTKTCALLRDGRDNWCSIGDVCSVNKHISDSSGLIGRYLHLPILQKKAPSAAQTSKGCYQVSPTSV